MSEANGGETIQARRQRLSVIPRACEACRIRKTRCDRTNPCSNCQAAGIACRPITTTPEIRAKPDRVTQLESLVESLSKRLSTVEDKLKSHGASPAQSSVSGELGPDTKGNVVADPVYEGRSSFNTQSVQANEFIKRKADSNGLREGSELDASLTYLTTLLQPSSGPLSLQDYHFSSSPSSRIEAPLSPLPIELIVTILQKIKANPPMVMNSFLLNDVSLLESLCQRVCFPTEPISIGHVTMMHGILYFILKEYISLSDPICTEHDLKSYMGKCEQKLHAGIETYEVLAVPTFENIFALTIGILKAQAEAKLLLCSSLIAAAASHCQMLGYHSEMSYRNDQPRKSNDKRRVFWILYVFDKSFSLLLGHASKIQDFEVDVQYPPLSTDPGVRPWEDIFILYVRMARIQGQIYSRLYSPAGVKAQQSERLQCISDLKAAMEQWRVDLSQVDCSRVRHPDLLSLSKEGWDIIYYSSLTLLLRASSVPGTAGELTSDCFQAARRCLETHITCFSAYEGCEILTDAEYANSIFYFSSFTPFIVVFLHSIAGSSIEDVRLLESVVRILQRVRGGSKAVEHLYQICATFAKLARGLVQSQSSCLGTYNVQEDSLQFSNAGQFSTLEPEDIQNYFGTNMMDYITDSEALDMSTILAGWANGPPSAVNFFGNNTGDPQY